MSDQIEPIPEWKVVKAHGERMKDPKFAELFASAPIGAKRYYAFESYCKMFPEDVSGGRYLIYFTEVAADMDLESLKFMLRNDNDPVRSEWWKKMLLEYSSARGAAAPQVVPEPAPEPARPAPVEESKAAEPAPASEAESKKDDAASEPGNDVADDDADDDDAEVEKFTAMQRLRTLFYEVPREYRVVSVLAAVVIAVVLCVTLFMALRQPKPAGEGGSETAEAESAKPAKKPVDPNSLDALFEDDDGLFEDRSEAVVESAPAEVAPMGPERVSKAPVIRPRKTFDPIINPPAIEEKPPEPELSPEERARLQEIAKRDITPMLTDIRKLEREVAALQAGNPAVIFAKEARPEKNVERVTDCDKRLFPAGVTQISRRFRCPYRKGAIHDTETGKCVYNGYYEDGCRAFDQWYKWKILRDKVPATEKAVAEIREKDAKIKALREELDRIHAARRELE